MSQTPLSASEPWNLVADGYAETTMLVFEQFADEAIAASRLKPNATVLDVACGPGTLALRLAQHAGHRNSALHYCDADPISLIIKVSNTSESH